MIKRQLSELQIKLTFLSTVEERALLGRVTDLDDLGASEQLHDESGSDNGRDSQFHECSSVGRLKNEK